MATISDNCLLQIGKMHSSPVVVVDLTFRYVL